MNIVLNVFDQKDFDVFVYGHMYTEGNTALGTDCYLPGWQKKYDADWVFNAFFFNFDNYQNRQNKCAGRTLQYCYNPHIGVIGYNASAPAPTPTITLNTGCKFCGWNLAILDGIVQSPRLNKTTKRARNMNGLTADGRYIHVTTDRQTEVAVATEVNRRIKNLYKTTVKYLFIEDSGGSTQEYSAISKLGYYPEGQRAVATVIGVRRKSLYIFTRTLHIGCRGEDVMVLQQALGGIEVDGIFGLGTASRLRQAQKALGLTADAYFGPMSAAAMGYGYRKG